jgi:hypothetical protein
MVSSHDMRAQHASSQTRHPPPLLSPTRARARARSLSYHPIFYAVISYIPRKELDVLLQHVPILATDLTRFFNDGWAMAQVPQADVKGLTATYFDQDALKERSLPCWSSLLPTTRRCNSPLPPASSNISSKADPLMLHLHGAAAPASPVYVSCAPMALCSGA